MTTLNYMPLPNLISHSIDAICYDIILKPETRVKRNETLESLLKQVDQKELPGSCRLRTIALLSDLIIKLDIGAPPTDLNAFENDDRVKMDLWDASTWEEYTNGLKDLRNKLDDVEGSKKFMAAPLIGYHGIHNDEKEQEGGIGSAEKNTKIRCLIETLDTNYETILDMCYFHWAISHLRLEVEYAMNGPKGTQLQLEENEIHEMYDFIQSKFNEGNAYYDCLQSLFILNADDDSGGANNGKHIQLIEVKEIYNIMTSNQCPSLAKFRKLTIRLLQNWYMHVYGDDEPMFVKNGYVGSYNGGDIDKVEEKWLDIEEGVQIEVSESNEGGGEKMNKIKAGGNGVKNIIEEDDEVKEEFYSPKQNEQDEDYNRLLTQQDIEINDPGVDDDFDFNDQDDTAIIDDKKGENKMSDNDDGEGSSSNTTTLTSTDANANRSDSNVNIENELQKEEIYERQRRVGARKRQKTRRFIDEFDGTANTKKPNDEAEKKYEDDEAASNHGTENTPSASKSKRGFKSPRFVDEHETLYSSPSMNPRKRKQLQLKSIASHVEEFRRYTPRTILQMKEDTTKRIMDNLDSDATTIQTSITHPLETQRLETQPVETLEERINPQNMAHREEHEDTDFGLQDKDDEDKYEETQPTETLQDRHNQQNMVHVEKDEDADFGLQDKDDEGIDEKVNTKDEAIEQNENKQCDSNVIQMEESGDDDEDNENTMELDAPGANSRSTRTNQESACSSLTKRGDVFTGRPRLKSLPPHKDSPRQRIRVRNDDIEETEDEEDKENISDDERGEQLQQNQRDTKDKTRSRVTSPQNKRRRTQDEPNYEDEDSDYDFDEDQRKPKGKRCKWTAREKDAVKEGFRKYGHDWAKIKKSYSAVLSKRTNVNIKDCYRTMQNRGEI